MQAKEAYWQNPQRLKEKSVGVSLLPPNAPETPKPILASDFERATRRKLARHDLTKPEPAVRSGGGLDFLANKTKIEPLWSTAVSF